MPGSIINRTAAGTPYLDDDNYVETWPQYTLELAQRIEDVEEPSGAVSALLAAAQAARDAALAAQAAAAASAASLADSGWLAATNVKYRKIGSMVFVTSVVTQALAAGAAVDPLFTLPAGFRPATDPVAIAANVNGNLAASGEIRNNGTCVFRNTSATAATSLRLAASFAI